VGDSQFLTQVDYSH